MAGIEQHLTNLDERVRRLEQIVERQLQNRTVRTSDQELFKANARKKGSVKLIDIVKARLDSKTDSFLVELPSLGIKDVRIVDTLVHEHERMLSDGFFVSSDRLFEAALPLQQGSQIESGIDLGWIDPNGLAIIFLCLLQIFHGMIGQGERKTSVRVGGVGSQGSLGVGNHLS